LPELPAVVLVQVACSVLVPSLSVISEKVAWPPLAATVAVLPS